MKELTNIDLKIIQLMAEGTTQRQMAIILGYKEPAIETIRHKLYKKLGVFNAPHCVSFALRNHIIS